MAGALLTAFLAAAAMTGALGALAGSLGWIDRREGQEHRKPRTSPVPLVGGVAVLGGAAVAALVSGGAAGLGDLPWPALVGAVVLGLVDDLRPGGLDPRVKLQGQVAVALLLALFPGGFHGDIGVFGAFGLALLAVVAMNAVNTWDHADGFAGGLGAVALLPAAPGLAAACAGYLPFNTALRRRDRSRGPGARADDPGAPRAMLGDSGAHVLGVALAAAPGAGWFLLLPLLDLARVAVARERRGQPFWRGDRTHLGHRLEGLGFHPGTAGAIAALLVAPPLAAMGLSTGFGPLAVTLLASAALYFAVLVLTEEADPGTASSLDAEPPPTEAPRGPKLAPAPEPEHAPFDLVDDPGEVGGVDPRGPGSGGVEAGTG